MTTPASSEQLQQLIATLESKSKSFPSSIDFYRFGLALQHTSRKADVIAAYDAYIQKLPLSYLSNIMKELALAFESIISASQGMDDIRNASLSIAGLCCNSTRACQVAYSVNLCTTLASAHNNLSNRKHEYETDCTILLQTLNALLIGGLIPSLADMQQETALQRTMELVQALTADEKNTFLGDALHASDNSFLGSIRNMFHETPDERDYLIRMLESSPKAGDFVTRQPKKQQSTVSAHPSSTKVDSQTEIQRRIQQVKNVLPDLGDGYIETALSNFSGDVSSTVTALLDPSSLPPALQRMDKQLPARRKETAKSTAYELNDHAARKVTKDQFANMERQQEAEAFALTAVHNEYDDDYDDQYDGMDAGVGGTGGTYDDVDLSKVKIFNRVTRDAERETAFWEQDRNTNRQRKQQQPASKKKSDEKSDDKSDDEEEEVVKTYRGSDKIKGGRVLGPDGKVVRRQPGGKKGVNQQSANSDQKKQEQGKEGAGDDMSKLQKRRKNDNKAKLGNHHRKDRAQKKAAGAM